MNHEEVDDFLTEVVEGDIRLLIKMQDLCDVLYEELGDNEERWKGAQVVIALLAPAFADHFGRNLLYHKRQPPKPEVVMSFAYLMGLVDTLVMSGPAEA